MLSLQRTLLPSLVLQLCCIGAAQSQSSTALYIPGFDPQPISADVIGVGPDGRTTWALHQGKPDATDTASYADFIGTATLVEGPVDASLTYANSLAQFTIGMGCTFSEGTLAICTIAAQGSTATQTEVVTRLPIQGGGTVIATRTSIAATTTPSLNPTIPASSSSVSSSVPSITPSGTLTQSGTLPTGSSSPNSSVPKRGVRALHSMQVTVLVIVSWFFV